MTGNAQSNGSSNLEIAHSNQDLIMTKGKQKKRTYIIAGVVSAIVVGLIVAAVVLLTRGESSSEDNEPSERGPTLSLEDLLQSRANPEPFNATWASESELLYTDSSGNLVLHGLSDERKPRNIILESENMIFGSNNFEISADKKYLKVAHEFQKNYRHSYIAKYTIFNLESKERVELHMGEQFHFLLAVWGPQGNSLAVVFKNNIYYKPSVDSEIFTQITFDAEFIYNGIPDWVYEEEVFSSNKALWFSPDGSKLAYARFNDTQVPFVVLPIYGDPGSLLSQYPKANVIKYPKAGTRNPTVSLHLVDLTNPTDITTLGPPSSQLSILTAVSWANNDAILAIWMNRVQNEAHIVSYLITQNPFVSTTVKSLKQESGWLEMFTAPVFSSDGSRMALILSVDQGQNRGSYRHVALLSNAENAAIEPLTAGAFVVTEILGWNHDRNKIFYLANTEDDSAVQHLYSVSVDTKQIECLSCGVKSRNKQLDCLYNEAEFNRDSSYYALTCAGPDVPDISIYSLDGHVLNWTENKELRELTASKLLPKTKRLTFDVEGGFKAQVYLKLPPNLNENDKTKKYPMLVNVYAGPDSFQVVEKFNIDWGSYLSANKSIIYATIDGRSSGLKGDKMLFAAYRQLGTVEIEDQISVTKQMQESLSYVDPEKTAVWGWSYGGYASGMMLANDKTDIFKCGISVAPVTDWTLYDSIYTERFMGLPSNEDNYKGYRDASLLLKFDGLRNKNYFLIHGTHDDNVHYQQSMLWAKTLEQHDILFRQLSYPDEDHSLGSVRPHLYHSLEEFLNECKITN